MPTPLDIEALRRAGLLPNWEEDWPGQPGSPAAMQNVTPVMAPRTNPATTRPFPWTVEKPSKTPGAAPERVSGPFASLTDTQIGGFPGGIIRGPGADPNEPTTLARPAPETAVFTREDPTNLARWLAKKGEEKAAQEAASQRRVELAGRAEDEAKQQQQMQRAQIQQALQGVLQTQGLLAYLQAVKSLQPPTPTGSAEGQAFGHILRTKGLPEALQWLQTREQAGGRRGPLTPEERYAGIAAETAARFGPDAQALRGATAAEVAAGKVAGTAEGTLDAPVLAKRGNWMNPATGETAKETDTPRQLMQRGLRFVDDKARTATTSSRAALAQIAQYRELAQQLLPSLPEGGSFLGNVARTQGNRGRIWALRLSGDPAARRLAGMFGTIAAIARATGDTANIAVQERQMLQESVVTPEDSLQSAEAKLKQLETILQAIQAGWGTTDAYLKDARTTGPSGGPAAPSAPQGSLSGQRTSRPDGQYEMGGQVYTVRGGVIQ